ncbi:hypothetical protein CONLIGDRAFT_100121 [Coniochaeta ligniaria NRRL 30616]|uniref:FAD dependent oxidoreductase domain-containing protein n=1 Tax=Coniochaeta ligniaria NRRL 30616 TaxID=1408157 RepID=A0A1J7IA31_9PEZI|nr:hypothetical protein CONLIGDRAFT_100121 [Coniochaeta ligniaria NRRL 30616]
MDRRAAQPVSLPRTAPTTSYWQDPPDRLADARTTPDLPASADVVIIGSGMTGAATAWNLLKHIPVTVTTDDGSVPPAQSNKPSVVVLEARGACSGATGRNGEFLFSFFFKLCAVITCVPLPPITWLFCPGSILSSAQMISILTSPPTTTRRPHESSLLPHLPAPRRDPRYPGSRQDRQTRTRQHLRRAVLRGRAQPGRRGRREPLQHGRRRVRRGAVGGRSAGRGGHAGCDGR